MAGLQLRLPLPRPLDESSGRRPEPALAEAFVDLGVRVAVHLADRGLPASLAPALVSTLLPDLFVEARPVAPDDRLALDAWARNQPAERLDDAVARSSGGDRCSRRPRRGERGEGAGDRRALGRRLGRGGVQRCSAGTAARDRRARALDAT